MNEKSLRIENRYKQLRKTSKDALVKIVQSINKLDMSHVKSETKDILISYILNAEYSRKDLDKRRDKMFDWSKPDYINEQNVKWWVDKLTTNYARKEDMFGTTWPTVTAFVVELPTGERTYLLVDDGVPVFEHTQLEAVAAHIDIVKLSKRDRVKGE